MSVRRGAFRLWVIVSAAWFATVIGIAATETSIPSVMHGCELLLDFSADATGKRLSDEDVRACNTVWRSERARLAAVALTPPAVLLLAGLAIGWVIRGFKDV